MADVAEEPRAWPEVPDELAALDAAEGLQGAPPEDALPDALVAPDEGTVAQVALLGQVLADGPPALDEAELSV